MALAAQLFVNDSRLHRKRSTRTIQVRNNLRALMRCLSVAYTTEFADVVIRACHIVANEHFVAFNEDYNAEVGYRNLRCYCICLVP